MKNGSKSARAVFTKTSSAPNEAALAVINTFALAELSADQVYVRTAVIAHNGIDRDKEIFDDGLLDQFAGTLPGKGLFIKHPTGWDGDSAPGVGRWFAARTRTVSLDEARMILSEPNLQWAPGVTSAKLLEGDFYIPKHDATAATCANIDAGVAGFVSIGFRALERVPVKDAGGNTVAMRLVPPGEALEASLVWLGAQPGARITKHFNPQQGADMNEAELKALQDQLTAARANEALYKALVTAIGEDLAKSPAQLVALIADAKTYRDELTDDVVRLERLAKSVGDTDADVAAFKGYLAAMPVAALKQRRDALGKTHNAPAAAQITEGDPNAGGGQGTTGKADANNPLAKAAGLF